MNENTKTKNAKKFVPVVAVLNMKGGVGKTTISANLSRAFFDLKKISVLLIDIDPQFNLSQVLLTGAEYDELKEQGRTVHSIFEINNDNDIFVTNSNESPAPCAKDICETLWYYDTDPIKPLDLVPGDFRLVRYTLLDHQKFLKNARKRFLQFVGNERKKYDLIMIDCNPSSSFLTLCALEAASHVLAPVRPDKYSILGLSVLHQFVQSEINLKLKPEFAIILNGMTRRNASADVRAVEAQLRAHPLFGTRTLASTIFESGHLRAKADYTGFAMDRTGSWSNVVKRELLAAANELAPKLGL